MEFLDNIQQEHIEHVYQPLCNAENGNIFGYEALLRFTDESLTNIEEVFEWARKKEKIYELDTISIWYAVDSFPLHRLNSSLLFINVYPSTVLHLQFKPFIDQLIKKYPQIRDKVVLEINESKIEEDNWKNPEFKKMLMYLKENGFSIALDDIGKGVATFQKIIEMSPNYIKLDRYFSIDLHSTKEKQHFISLLVKFAKNKMGLILEGIEKESDLSQAKLLQVPFVQGYLLGKPQKINNFVNTFQMK
jgi:EAL domain-containing protein (putative c-di-GMP-specific phosphodiesterase class I)